MKQSEMARLQEEIFEFCKGLRKAGQAEYAHDDNEAFANFHRVAHSLGIDRKQVLWTYLQKHLDGITAAINGHLSQREPVYGRISDAIVYLTLLYGMFLEDEKHKLQASQTLQPPGRVDNLGGSQGMAEGPIVDPGSSVGHVGASPRESLLPPDALGQPSDITWVPE